MVSGKYVSNLSDASHVLFDGNLNDPTFRGIAIQRITKLEESNVTLERSGLLKIEKRQGKQIVKTSFVCPLFGKQVTTGHPFKDERTDAISVNVKGDSRSPAKNL